MDKTSVVARLVAYLPTMWDCVGLWRIVEDLEPPNPLKGTPPQSPEGGNEESVFNFGLSLVKVSAGC